MRIVSLLPSATEIVCSLGLQDQIVGISHSCDYPAEICHLPVMTRTTVPRQASSEQIDSYVRGFLGENSALYQLNLDLLEKASPDVIVSQRLCDVCAVSTDDVLAALQRLSSQPGLVDLEPAVLADVFSDIRRVGTALDASAQAERVVAKLENRISLVAARTRTIAMELRPRVALLEWLLPPFNSGHWNPELVELAGGTDCLGPKGKPSQTVSWSDVLAAHPDIIVVACCGFSRQRASRDFEQLANQRQWRELVKSVSGRVYITDGNAYFSRPGPRLVDSLEALAHALHPSIHPPSATGAQVSLAENVV